MSTNNNTTTTEPLLNSDDYIFLFITVLGTFSWIFSLYQTCQTRKIYPKLVIMIFFKTMVIIDLFNLLLAGLVILAFNKTTLVPYLMEFSFIMLNVSCKVYNYCIYTLSICSHGLLMIMSFDRYLMLTRHRFLRMYYSVFVAKIFLVFYLVILALGNFNYLWIYDFLETSRICSVSQSFNDLFFKIFIYIEFTFEAVIPTLFNIIVFVLVFIQQCRGKAIFAIDHQLSTCSTDQRLRYCNKLLFPLVFLLAWIDIILDLYKNHCKLYALIVQSGDFVTEVLKLVVLLSGMKYLAKFVVIGFGMIIIRHKCQSVPSAPAEMML